MQINNISQQQPVFGKLVSGKNLRKTLAPDRQDLINKYNVIKLYIRHENLHKINNNVFKPKHWCKILTICYAFVMLVFV